MGHEAIKEAAKSEILGSRALSYRRTTLAIGLILVALYLLQQSVDYSNLNLFGVKLRGDGPALRTLVLKAVWIVFLYHGLMFAYYAKRDFGVWVMSLVTKPSASAERHRFFPELRMYLWLPPRQLATKRMGFDGDLLAEKWVSKRHNNDLMWSPVRPSGLDPGANAYNLRVSEELVPRIRSKCVWFAVIDVGLPTAIFATACALAITGSP